MHLTPEGMKNNGFVVPFSSSFYLLTRVWNFKCKVWGSGFRVEDFGLLH